MATLSTPGQYDINETVTTGLMTTVGLTPNVYARVLTQGINDAIPDLNNTVDAHLSTEAGFTSNVSTRIRQLATAAAIKYGTSGVGFWG